MKRMVKKVLLVSLTVSSCAAVLVGGVWCSAQCDSSLCSEVNVVVEDSMKRQFVDADELAYFLKKHQCYPLGDSMRTVDCHEVEQCLLKHDMLQTVRCYKSPFSKVHIVVKQRVPILGVQLKNDRYYVDADRKIMPVRGEMDVDVPIFRGSVSERAAREEYFDFVKWLDSNGYWSSRIRSIYVEHPKYLVLSQEGENAKIILGSLDNYEMKLQKLRTLYTKGLDNMGSPEYREYDLRFDNQVVGRK